MSERNFYITTPIYYVNGTPHIGHAYTTIAADTAARFQRLEGRRVAFLTGTDEHGQKVLEKARERGMSPKAHCDDMVVHWKAMMERFGIGYTRFIRTTDADHVAAVQAVLQKLWDAGEIHRAEYTGWYSVKDEIFVTEKDIEDGLYDRSDLQEISESNYFFNMSAYQERLVAHIEANPDFIRPAARRNEVLGFLRQPLGDLCISRPKTRMSWGIELPFDTDYVTYVWFDALLNYLTGVGYHPDPAVAGDWQDWWPADVHLIGKDILTTHAVYWSTMLMALGVELPRSIYAHGWWKSKEGAKISKSLGNAIDVDLLAQAFGVDATRYFFLREISFGSDGGFSYEGFLTRYNADLANDLGNLAHRGLSMTDKWLGGTVPAWGTDETNVSALRDLATGAFGRFRQAMGDLQFNDALEAVWELVRAGNKHVDDRQPWALNKQGAVDELNTTMRLVLEVCAWVGALLLPILPDKSRELLRRVGLSEGDAEDLLARLRAGETPLDALTAGVAIDVSDPLFPRFRELPDEIAALLAPEPEPAPAPRKKKSKKGAAGPKPQIAFDDFAKVELKVGRITAAAPHPNADRLLVLTVDIGEPAPRQIVAGIASRYAPDELVGRNAVVVANLAPVELRGVESQGMLLAAGGKEVVDLVRVDAEPGEVVR